MTALSKNMTVKAMLVLCMLMQGALLFPHHHHGHNQTPCLVFTHCVDPHGSCAHDAEPAAEDRDCDGHSHDCPSKACAADRDIVAGLRIDRAHDAPQFPSAWFGCRIASSSGIPHIALADTESARLCDKERPFVERPYLVYVTRASLLRAPTQTV